MKIKDGFLLRQVAGQNVVVPVSSELDQDMMLTLNGTGAFLWERLSHETDADMLVTALLTEYDVDADTARTAVDGFIETLSGYGFLE